tara:strand:+ start:39 stop:839 length:801 start_codon:yes stop_codon:yes gene_type:complete
MGLREQTIARTDRNQYDPKTKTGWKQVKGVWKYFVNGREKDTGIKGMFGSAKDFLYELPGKVREQNRNTDTTPFGFQPDKDQGEQLDANAIRADQKIKAEAINWFRLAVENPAISDQLKVPLLKSSFELQNSFNFSEDDATLSYVKAIELADQQKEAQIAANTEARNTLSAADYFGTKIPNDEVDEEIDISNNNEKQEPVVETKLKTEAEARKEWLEKTRNSPAQKSGAFTDQQLWELSKKSGANKGIEFAPAIDEKKPIEIRKPK